MGFHFTQGEPHPIRVRTCSGPSARASARAPPAFCRSRRAHRGRPSTWSAAVPRCAANGGLGGPALCACSLGSPKALPHTLRSSCIVPRSPCPSPANSPWSPKAFEGQGYVRLWLGSGSSAPEEQLHDLHAWEWTKRASPELILEDPLAASFPKSPGKVSQARVWPGDELYSR